MARGPGFPARIATIVVATCFAIGCCNHLRHFATMGPRPYRWAPPPLELFWSILAPLDAAVAILLASGRRRAGLGLALAVMVADVGANLCAVYVLDVSSPGAALLCQVALLGFLGGAVPFLWRDGAGAPTSMLCQTRSPGA